MDNFWLTRCICAAVLEGQLGKQCQWDGYADATTQLVQTDHILQVQPSIPAPAPAPPVHVSGSVQQHQHQEQTHTNNAVFENHLVQMAAGSAEKVVLGGSSATSTATSTATSEAAGLSIETDWADHDNPLLSPDIMNMGLPGYFGDPTLALSLGDLAVDRASDISELMRADLYVATPLNSPCSHSSVFLIAS